MNAEGIEDAVLVEDCAEFRNLFASYVTSCRILEEVEIGVIEGQDIEQVREEVSQAGRRWRTMLVHLRRSCAQTTPGVIAKAGAIGCFLSQYPPGCEITGLMYSLCRDVETVFRDCDS